MRGKEFFPKACSDDEAIKLTEQTTIEVFANVLNCYKRAYGKIISKDRFLKEGQALSAVYIMGYVSGVRRERQRKNRLRQQSTPKKDI